MSDKSTPVPDDDHDLLMSVKELKHYVEEVEQAKAKQSLAAYSKVHEKQKALLKQLRSEEPIPETMILAFLLRLKEVALTGEEEILIGRFPCDICTDHGRAINQSEEGWPDTLVGRPRKAYEFWRDHLKPLGYRLKAQIIDWPSGLPGDIGLFLSWKG